MRTASVSVPRSTISWSPSRSVSRISSRRWTPRWSNATATFTRRTVHRIDLEVFRHPAKGEVVVMNDVELWRELGQQLRVDAILPAAKAGSGHPTSGMSAADL